MDAEQLVAVITEPMFQLLRSCPGVELVEGVYGGGEYMAKAAEMLPWVRKQDQKQLTQVLRDIELLLGQIEAYPGPIWLEWTGPMHDGTGWGTGSECYTALCDWLVELVQVIWTARLGSGIPAWVSSDSACGIAAFLSDSKSFDGLPILADALEEAGCTEPILLNHCRQGEQHHRACWAVVAIMRLCAR